MADDSLLKRDSNVSHCYAWEALAFPNSPKLEPIWCGILIQQVHDDVIRLVGQGAAHPRPQVLFDIQTDGSAAGKWGVMRFNKDGAIMETVLHEIAHSLTWSGTQLYNLARQKNSGSRLLGIQHHLDFVLCNMGHGPRFVAC